MADIVNINDYRTQSSAGEHYEVPRPMCLRPPEEKSRVSPVETPKIEPKLPGPHIARPFIHEHPTL